LSGQARTFPRRFCFSFSPQKEKISGNARATVPHAAGGVRYYASEIVSGKSATVALCHGTAAVIELAA
jgi:hypothetical protein